MTHLSQTANVCERNCPAFDIHCLEMLSPYIDVKFMSCLNFVVVAY